MQKSICFLRISSILAGMGFASFAFGAGFQINEVSPTLQAVALADAATVSGDLSGMAFNPATLATIGAPDIYVAGSIIVPHVSYQNATSSLPVLLPAGTSTVTAENNISPTAVVPAAYAGMPLPGSLDHWSAGIGVDVPFGLETNYNANWVGQFNALESQVQVINVLPTVAYQFTPNFDVGASIDVEYLTATYTNSINYDGFLDGGNSSLMGNTWGAGFALGAMYKLTPTTTLGADYHSVVRESLKGQATVTGDALYQGNYPGSVIIHLPATFNLGVSQQITNRFTLMAGGEWTQWNTIPSIDVNVQGIGTDNSQLNYSNTWLFSLGGSYILTPKLTLMGGVAYDETPTNNQDRDARIPDTNREWITTGLSYNATSNLSLFGTYEHIFMNDQSINSSEGGAGGLSPSQVSVDYSGYANILAMGLNYSFK